MNTLLSSKPSFSDAHFVYGRPAWFEAVCRVFALLLGAAMGFGGAALSSSALAQIMLLIAAISLLVAISPRSEWASVYFICDHDGMYFPDRNAHVFSKRKNEIRWLFVPWTNVSDIRNQLMLDETANTQGIVFSIQATEAEQSEFLARLTLSRQLIRQKNLPSNSFLVGFSSFFHHPAEVISELSHFRSLRALPSAESMTI